MMARWGAAHLNLFLDQQEVRRLLGKSHSDPN